MRYRTSPVRMARLALLVLVSLLFAPALLWAQEATDDVMKNSRTTFLPLVTGGGQTPSPAEPDPAAQMSGATREGAMRLYRELFVFAALTRPDSTGDADGCIAPTLGVTRMNALFNQVNYFRQMAGVPAVVLDAGLNAQASATVQVMAANRRLTHQPTPDMRCYTVAAANAAPNSNLNRRANVGRTEWPDFPFSPTGIADQVMDLGADNNDVKHRFWLLHPRLTRAGIAESYVYYAEMRIDPATALPFQALLAATFSATYVIDPQVNYQGDWSAARDGMVAWPPAGFVPKQVVYPRWSLHFPKEANLAGAAVQMWLDGVPLALTVVHRGEQKNSLVWEPALDMNALDWDRDHAVRVVVSGIASGTIEYEVQIFDADR